MIKTGIRGIRDPFVVRDGGTYYIYGTGVAGGWDNSTYDCYKSVDGLSGAWEKITLEYEIPKNAVKQFWAPEVHKYKGQFYLFASYFSSLTGHRGCAIWRSPSPEGPFVEITDGHITPSEWDAIDGTLYVDEHGEPWMFFVHEWTSTPDKVGRMAVAKLSSDLTRFVSEPKDLFEAKDPEWSNSGCTDGPFIYKTREGQLLMLWSTFLSRDYCVAIARSHDGITDGEWTHDAKVLFSKEMADGKDGGHGMIFTDTVGQMYLSVHSPNKTSQEEKEETVFLPIREENGTLVVER